MQEAARAPCTFSDRAIERQNSADYDSSCADYDSSFVCVYTEQIINDFTSLQLMFGIYTTTCCQCVSVRR